MAAARLLIDTGPLVALFDRRDKAHPRVSQLLAGFRGELLTTWPVLTETCHLLPRHIVVPFTRIVPESNVRLHELPATALTDIAAMMEKYADLPMDLADASLLWLATASGVHDVLTLDEADFGIYRLPGGQRLRSVLARGV